MLKRIINGNTDNFKKLSRVILVIMICILTVSALLCISAFAISHIDFTYESLPAVTAAILGVSSLFDGFVISKLSKENGLFWGIFAGIVIFVCLVIISLMTDSFNLAAGFFTKSAITVIAGAIGGVVGVNTN